MVRPVDRQRSFLVPSVARPLNEASTTLRYQQLPSRGMATIAAGFGADLQVHLRAQDLSGVGPQNLPKRILGYELSLTSQRPYVRWSICPLGAPGAAGRLEQSGAGAVRAVSSVGAVG